MILLSTAGGLSLVVQYYPTVDGVGVQFPCECLLAYVYVTMWPYRVMVWYCHRVDGTSWYHGCIG